MKSFEFEYTNYTGETRTKKVTPKSIRFGLISEISEPEWILEAFDLDKNENQNFVMKNIQRVIDEKVQRYYCVTVYVMDGDKFLMLLNKKLSKWVPPGGKIDRHETPEEAAIRECFEETGVHVKLLEKKAPIEGGLISPSGMQLNHLSPTRDHVDFIFKAFPKKSTVLKISQREASNIGWFSYEEVLKLDTFLSVKQWCKIFHEELKK
jgi:8-oxo-dGTP pyrophosphatase MutT (NUDIX family)